MSALDVYLKGNWAGRLEEALDGLVFAYNEWFCMRLASLLRSTDKSPMA